MAASSTVTNVDKCDVDHQLQVYQSVISELKSCDVNSNLPLHMDDAKRNVLIPNILEHLSCQIPELSITAIETLTLMLRFEYFTRSLSDEVTRRIVSAICDSVQSTTDKVQCAKLFKCLSHQTLNKSVLASELSRILKAIETGQCHKNLQSINIEFEGNAAISRLLDQLPKEMAENSPKWAHLVYPVVLSTNARVRDRALATFKKGLPAILSHRNEIALNLAADLQACLVKELQDRMTEKQELHVLDVWSHYVKILGTLLHRNSLCNHLLPIVERGFKHLDQDVRHAAFKAWQALIDNFALTKDYISDQKRVRLIMQVFLGVQPRSESLALLKFTVWWHFILCLDDRAAGLFEQVVIPLLQYSIGLLLPPTSQAAGKLAFKSPATPSAIAKTASVSSPIVASTASPLGFHSPSLGQQPSQTYPALCRLGFEALTMILLKAVGEDISHSVTVNFTIDPLQHDVICRTSTFGKYSSAILQAVKHCMTTMSVDVPNSEMLVLWRVAVRQVAKLLELTDATLKNERLESFSALLDMLKEVTTAQCFKPDTIIVLLNEVVSQIPQRILASPSYHVGNSTEVMQGCPCVVLIEQLFNHRVMEVSSEHEGFTDLLTHLLKIGQINTVGALGFYQTTLDLLVNSVTSVDKQEILAKIWMAIASSVQELISQTNEVNQGNNLAHDFTCMHSILMFPILHLINSRMPQATVDAAIKLWEQLYKNFARLSSMVVNVEANTACEELAGRILAVNDNSLMKDAVFLSGVSELLSVMVNSFDFTATSAVTPFVFTESSPAKILRRKKQIGNIHSIIHLEQTLLKAIVSTDLQSNEALLNQCLPAILSVLSRTFASYQMSQSTLTAVLNVLVDCLAELYKFSSSGPAAVFSQKLFNKLEKLWANISSSIQNTWQTGFDSDLLALLAPLLASVLSHSRRSLLSQAVKFWTHTFAKSSSLSYPSCMRPVMARLKEKNLVMLPGWENVDIDEVAETPICDLTFSQGDTSDIVVALPSVVGVPSPKKSIGSLLQRVAGDSPVKPVVPFASNSPKRDMKPPTKLAPQAKRGRRSLSKQPESLIDMSSQDFVPIVNTRPTTNKLVLTEHQREVLREKRVLPTMYNNLDANSQSLDVFSAFHADATQTVDSSSCSDIQMSCPAKETDVEVSIKSTEAATNYVVINDSEELLPEQDTPADVTVSISSGSSVGEPSECALNVPSTDVDSQVKSCKVHLCRLPELSSSQNTASVPMAILSDSELCKERILTPAKLYGKSSDNDMSSGDSPARPLVKLFCESALLQGSCDDGESNAGNDRFSNIGPSTAVNADTFVEDSQFQATTTGKQSKGAHSEITPMSVEETPPPCVADSSERIEPELQDSVTKHLFPPTSSDNSEQGVIDESINSKQSSVANATSFKPWVSTASISSKADVVSSDEGMRSSDTDSAAPSSLKTEGSIASAVEPELATGDGEKVATKAKRGRPKKSLTGDKSSLSGSITVQGSESSTSSASQSNSENSDEAVSSAANQRNRKRPSRSKVTGAGISSSQDQETSYIGGSQSSHAHSSASELEDLKLSRRSSRPRKPRASVDELTDSAAAPASSSNKTSQQSTSAVVTADSCGDVSCHRPVASVQEFGSSDSDDDLPLSEVMPLGGNKLDSSADELPLSRLFSSAKTVESTGRQQAMKGAKKRNAVDVDKTSADNTGQEVLRCESSENLEVKRHRRKSTVPHRSPERVLHSTLRKKIVRPSLKGQGGKMNLRPRDLKRKANSVSLLIDTSDSLVSRRQRRKLLSGCEENATSVMSTDIDNQIANSSLGKSDNCADDVPADRSTGNDIPDVCMSENRDYGVKLSNRVDVDAKADGPSRDVTPSAPAGENADSIELLPPSVDVKVDSLSRDDAPSSSADESKDIIEQPFCPVLVNCQDHHTTKDAVDEVSEYSQPSAMETDSTSCSVPGNSHSSQECLKSDTYTCLVDDGNEVKSVELSCSAEIGDLFASSDAAAGACELVNLPLDEPHQSEPTDQSNDKPVHDLPDSSAKVTVTELESIAEAEVDDEKDSALDTTIEQLSECTTVDEVKFTMPVGRPSAFSSGDAPPETPTSASRHHQFASRGSMMLQRAKQLQTKTSAEPQTKPSDDGSPTQKPSFLQHIYSPSASPSASILRKRHLCVPNPTVESPSPPNKQRRVCFNDNVETHEIPSRHSQQDSLTKRRMCSNGRSMGPGPLSLNRPVNRQLQLPGQQAKFRTRSILVPTRIGLQNRNRFVTLTSPKPNSTRDTSRLASEEASNNVDEAADEMLPVESVEQTNCALGIDNLSEESDTASPGASLQPVSLHMTQESQLDSSEPIYEQLMDCREPVEIVLPKLTTASWLPALEAYMRKISVKTIGDLCSLTELEVHDLPIQQPKVGTVRRVLDQFAVKYSASRPSESSLASDDAAESATSKEASFDDLMCIINEGVEAIKSYKNSLTTVEFAQAFEGVNFMTQGLIALLRKPHN